jgi:hypothetical protein
VVKGETVMPIPGGDISTSKIWEHPVVEETPVAEEAVEVADEEENDQA